MVISTVTLAGWLTGWLAGWLTIAPLEH